MTNRQPLIAALAGLGVAVLIVAILLLPKAHQVSAKQKQVEQAQAQEQSLRLQLKQLQAVAKEAPKDRQKLAQLQAEVPPTVDLPGLIRLLDTAAQQSGVDFTSLSPGQPTAGPDARVSVIPASIIVGGSFFSVDQYLIQLESLPRAAKILSITITPGGGGTATTGGVTSELQITLTVNFYTTDTSAGPGSAPGPTGPGGAPAPAPQPTISPGISPSPSVSGPFSPSPTGSPAVSPSGSPSGNPSGSPSPSPSSGG